jgi:uncharacterized membrane protein YtjA (UPF0391 family)
MTTIAQPTPTTCDTASRVTKSLLGYGVITGPVYVGVSLAQALTRQGFDPTRHAWSLLSTGDLGWIQITNFVLSGLMTVAAAVGLRRAGIGRWTPRLVAGYGLSLVAAGIFRPDPADGFPVGTPAGANTISWHGMLHLLSGSVGFACLIAACLVTARAFRRAGRRGWAVYSLMAGVVLLAGFAGIASGSHGAATTLPFTAAVVLVCSWLSAYSAHVYRHVN